MISYDSIKYILYGTSVIVGLAATIIGGLYYNQDKLLYMPNPPGISFFFTSSFFSLFFSLIYLL